MSFQAGNSESLGEITQVEIELWYVSQEIKGLLPLALVGLQKYTRKQQQLPTTHTTSRTKVLEKHCSTEKQSQAASNEISKLSSTPAVAQK